MDSPIRWGMIGCGSVAETKSGPAFSLAADSKLKMVMSRSIVETKNFADRHGIVHWTTDPDELVHSQNVDAIYVATPPDSHLYYAELVASAGKPLLMEKPIARNVKEAEELIRCCSDAGIPLFVAYYRRALPRFLKVKDLLDTGQIGDLRFVHIQHHGPPNAHPVSPIDQCNPPPPDKIPWRFLPDISGGGNFVDCGTHMLDMVDFLLGPLTNITGYATNHGEFYPAEDTVSGSFLVNGKIFGTGQWSYVTGTELDRIEIVGSRGAIRVSCFDENPIELQTASGVKYIEALNPKYWAQPFIQTVVNALLGKGECFSSGENALRAIKAQSDFLSSYYAAPPGSSS